MEIIRLPVLSDNYIFLLHDPVRNIAAVVDPAEAQPVLEELKKLKAELVAIFNTHHHGDHVARHLVHPCDETDRSAQADCISEAR